MRDVDQLPGNSATPPLVASQVEDSTSLLEDLDDDEVTQLDGPWEGEEGETERSDFVSALEFPLGQQLDGVGRNKRPCLSPSSEL